MGLKLEHVSYLYGTDTELLVRALDDVNLEIPDGQFIGLIGHTGSGKSTLVQHLNGLLKPSEGTILFNGENIWAQDYSRKTLRSKVGLGGSGEAYVLEGGLEAWKAAGLPVRQDRKAPLEIMRQVQMTAGGLIRPTARGP